jgi:glycolate oxidase FAD binding subunit
LTDTLHAASADAWRAIAGEPHVRRAGPEDAIRGVLPHWIVEPADAAGVAAVLKAARDQGSAVIPRGGGTKGEWGNRPRHADVVLSTARLHTIVEHAWADLTVTVEAGCTIRALQDALRVHGQRVAADPLWPDTATVGGVLSANDTGALRLRFGGWRDLVIGTTLALADGTLARSGGKVVKNVAGYDLSKLATGAFGTLGVVTTAIFRLHPLPRVARTLTARIAGMDEVQKVLATIQDSKLAHTALQVRVSDARHAELDILFEGTEGGVDAQVRDLRTTSPLVVLGEADARVWNARENLWTDAGPILKVSVPLTAFNTLVRSVDDLASTAQTPWSAVFHATGLAWIRFDAPQHWPALVDGVRHMASRHDGSAVILRPASHDDGVDAWGDPGDALALMRAVKQQFDPNGTLNPGRFVGGI